MYLTLSKKISILTILLISFSQLKGQNFSLVQQNSIPVIVNNDTLLTHGQEGLILHKFRKLT